MSKKTTLKLIQNVTTNSSVSISHIPSNGFFEVKQFSADSPSGDKTYVELKYGTEVIWVIWGGGSMPIKFNGNGDGTTSITITSYNNNSYDVFISGQAEIVEY